MRVPLGYKFILGFVVVVAVVTFAPALVSRLGYPAELTYLLTIVTALTVGLVMGWFFSRRFTRNIGLLTASTHEVSQGDLSRDIRLPGSRMPDETHELAEAINLMVQNLRELVGHIRSSSGKLTLSAREINGTAYEIGSSTEEVARAVEQISRGDRVGGITGPRKRPFCTGYQLDCTAGVRAGRRHPGTDETLLHPDGGAGQPF